MFVNAIYQSQQRVAISGATRYSFRIKVRPEVLTFQPDGKGVNASGANTRVLPLNIPSTANRDGIGVYPRGVMIRWTGAPPNGYDPSGKLFVPVLTVNRNFEYHLYDTGMYLGSPYIIVSKISEQVRS